MARSFFGFKLNHAGVQALLDGAQGVDSLVRGEAEKVAAAARSNAPVASGAYRDSIHLEETHTDRLVVRVVADVPYAMNVEADHGTLARSL